MPAHTLRTGTLEIGRQNQNRVGTHALRVLGILDCILGADGRCLDDDFDAAIGMLAG